MQKCKKLNATDERSEAVKLNKKITKAVEKLYKIDKKPLTDRGNSAIMKFTK